MSEHESETASTSGQPEILNESVEMTGDLCEPDKKRRKLTKPEGKSEKLEHRLGGILCCAVCLDLPKAAIYQCGNGHLMCAGCFTHVLADARLRDEIATCPNCRVEISKNLASRNLAVEKAVSELPSECQFCAKEYARNALERHEETQCEERITGCKFSRIGCPWRGPAHDVITHEEICVHPHKTGAEVMLAMQAVDQKMEEEKKLYTAVFELLSYEKITFNGSGNYSNNRSVVFVHDLQMKPYRTDEFVHRLFYETSRFTAFNCQWMVKARINNSQRDPTQSSDRDMTYQLLLKSKTTFPMNLHYLILRGPFGDMKVQPRIYRHEFTDSNNETEYWPLPLVDSYECNRVIAAKAINFRLIMFLLSK